MFAGQIKSMISSPTKSISLFKSRRLAAENYDPTDVSADDALNPGGYDADRTVMKNTGIREMLRDTGMKIPSRY